MVLNKISVVVMSFYLREVIRLLTITNTCDII
ncbi:hypothetical protein CHY_2319 [Carboxydothermus hydrogenoformans Z-2901]|uniref:Uncharacterized protein n=1 Tax=Carboxydothermus hydrogenoformans (strain ATCC BAA-161 / DSM 6008 / Z-2901) TaxID=246194 RepID=Q3A9Q6_CARHZ|nr:hypothetical protein CHY_2319 [Carboxydothermus hydrogenoformans Z-2901]